MSGGKKSGTEPPRKTVGKAEGPHLPLPMRQGEPLEVLFSILAKRNPSSSILQMQRAPVTDLSQAQHEPHGAFSIIDESETAPPVKVLSVRQGSGPGTFRLDVEISRAVAELLGRVGSAFWPVFGAVEKQRKRERKQAERRARFDERMARYKQAGRIGYHRIRKATSPDHREQIVAMLMDRYRLERAAVDLGIKEHGKAFRSLLSKRRQREIFRLKTEGLSKPEIVDRLKVSIGLIDSVLRGPKKK